MISVNEALDHIFARLTALDVETIPLRAAAGRVLAKSVAADRAQPPFAASIMDGYAVSTPEIAPGDTFRVPGAAAAGHGAPSTLGPGEAVRIFTGAPVPQGAERVVIQEDVTRKNDVITINQKTASPL